MSISYNDLSIRGRNGKRVPVADCNLEPLNLLIPGGAPLLVPKKKAWRAPYHDARKDADYDTEGEDEVRGCRVVVPKPKYIKCGTGRTREQGSRDASSTSTRPQQRTSTRRCRKDSMVKEKAREAHHRRSAERHQAKAEKELEEADEKRKGLQERVEKQEAYIAKLKAYYEGDDNKKKSKAKASTAGKKKHVRVEDDGSSDGSSTTAASGTTYNDGTTTDGGASTDGSAKVREMLRHMKIRAGGGNGGSSGAFGSHDGGPFTASEDAQLLLHKNNGEAWKFIMDSMKRGKSELQKRFKELKASGATIPGEDIQADDGGDKAAAGGDTTDAEKTGEETTDAEKTGEETTDAEKTEDENKDGHGGETFLSNLVGALEAVVEGQAGKKDKPAKFHKSNNSGKKNKQQQQQKNNSHGNNNDGGNKNSPSSNAKVNGGGESGYDADGGEDSGTKRYLATYARQLVEERARIPEADEHFDEDDCVLLALTDSYRRHNRWMEIQSDFANVTGRMVPEAVLRWKLGEGDKPEDY